MNFLHTREYQIYKLRHRNSNTKLRDGNYKNHIKHSIKEEKLLTNMVLKGIVLAIVSMDCSCQKLPKEKPTTSLTIFLPTLKDTFLVDKDIGKLLTIFSKPQPGSIIEKIAKSGLL